MIYLFFKKYLHVKEYHAIHATVRMIMNLGLDPIGSLPQAERTTVREEKSFSGKDQIFESSL